MREMVEKSIQLNRELISLLEKALESNKAIKIGWGKGNDPKPRDGEMGVASHLPIGARVRLLGDISDMAAICAEGGNFTLEGDASGLFGAWNRGAKLVVVDVYRTPTAEVADLFIPVRPGTDGALACAIMHVLFEEGYADRKYLLAHTDFPSGLEGHLAERGPEWAAPITGVPAKDIIAFARLYGETKKSFIRVGYGFSRSRNASAMFMP